MHKIEREGRLNVDEVSMLLDVQATHTYVSAEDAKAGNVPICSYSAPARLQEHRQELSPYVGK